MKSCLVSDKNIVCLQKFQELGMDDTFKELGCLKKFSDGSSTEMDEDQFFFGKGTIKGACIQI